MGVGVRGRVYAGRPSACPGPDAGDSLIPRRDRIPGPARRCETDAAAAMLTLLALVLVEIVLWVTWAVLRDRRLDGDDGDGPPPPPAPLPRTPPPRGGRAFAPPRGPVPGRVTRRAPVPVRR